MAVKAVEKVRAQVPPARGGRKAQSVVIAGIRQSMDEVARDGVQYLRDLMAGKVRKVSTAKIDVAKFAIDHYLGKAAMKMTLPTDGAGRTIIPYSQIIVLATQNDDTISRDEGILSGGGGDTSPELIQIGLTGAESPEREPVPESPE